MSCTAETATDIGKLVLRMAQLRQAQSCSDRMQLLMIKNELVASQVKQRLNEVYSILEEAI